MDVSEFLFPGNLTVSETNIHRVLIIGSCLADSYRTKFRINSSEVDFDFILFNNTSKLPALDNTLLSSYDFQYILLPLRYIVTDQIINFSAFLSDSAAEEIFNHACQSLELMLESALKYNRTHNLLTFVSNFFVPQLPVVGALNQRGSANDFATLVKRLNDKLTSLLASYQNVYLADADSIGNSLGKKYFLDDMIGFYSHNSLWAAESSVFDTSPEWNAPQSGRIEALSRIDEVYESHSDHFFKAVWRHLECLYRIINQIDIVKLVIFDLDDTMWRGIIGEHYGDNTAFPVIHGWPVGIWETVQHLRARGIIVALCSKNDEDLVRKRWSRAVPLPWISLDDFAFKEINWKPKAENIANIINKANLTPKSCVFVDDNPVERESVKAAIPGIRVIGSNPYTTRRILLWSSETQLAARSAETTNREESIKKLQVREMDRTVLSREEFLASLNCSVLIDEIPSTEHTCFTRSLELLNKTNQFNTTGIRWNFGQISAFFNYGGRLFIFSVKDKYSDYGIVGVVLYRDGLFSQLAMSCRVLGLDIETSVINTIINLIRETEKRTHFYARVIETDSNMVCRDTFSKCGFDVVPDNKGLFIMQDYQPLKVAPHIRIEINND